MFQSLLQNIVTYLHYNPHAAGIIVFFIACGEAMAVIGTVIPGSITMTAVGVLIGSKVIPADVTIICAICGAIVGDSLSYFIGRYYKTRIHKIWPFRKYPHWLAKGETFFRKHGGKSVIIGRFFGPARSMVPLIAGTLNMSVGRFLLAAIPSASIWAIGYMVPGILLGAISLELPPGLAFEFIVAILVVIALCVVLTWVIQYYSRHLAKKIDEATKKLWKFLRQGKKTYWLTRLLADPRHPRNHRQLILLVYLIMVAILFLLFAGSALTHEGLIAFNVPLANLLRSFRTNIVDNIMLAFTILGSRQVMLVSAFLVLLWFCWKRYWRVASHWLAVVILTVAAVEAMKYLFFSARPGFLLNGQTNSSFPSGHTALVVSLLGFLAMLVAQELKFKLKRVPYIIAIVMAGLVGFSRLFLGAHWLTDVIGGVFLGLTIALLVTISYRRGDICRIALKQFAVIIISVFVVIWILFGFYNFKTLKHNYQLYWPTYTISSTAWQQRTTTKIPLYRPSRLGHSLEVFNVEWLGDLAKIKLSLEQQGWQVYEPNLTITGLLNRLETTSTKHPLPLLPQVYHNQYPVLLMTKDIGKDKQAIILRLWKSNIIVKNTSAPLWLGIVNYRLPYHKWFTIRKIYGRKKFLGATDEFIPYLKDFKWQEIIYSRNKQPKGIQKLHWNGKLLLIK